MADDDTADNKESNPTLEDGTGNVETLPSAIDHKQEADDMNILETMHSLDNNPTMPSVE